MSDRDKIEYMSASLANQRMQVEAERIAWSRLPIRKKIWYGLKRYCNLKDSYPFPRWLVQTRFDKICLFLVVVTAITVVIFFCYLVFLTIVVLSIVGSIGAL